MAEAQQVLWPFKKEKGRNARREPLAQPFLKWAGGKRQLLSEIRPLLPKKYRCYYEPFLGGGAVFLDQQPAKAIVNDFNSELINCYEVIKNSPDELLEEVAKFENTSDCFYRVREMDRSDDFTLLSDVKRAARIIYLNKTCFNGLFRVNSKGQFNAPFGHYKNPTIADPAIIQALSRYLNSEDTTFRNVDFAEAVVDAQKGDFVYFDPPYDPVSDTSSFTGYSLNGFNREEQIRLRDLCDALTAEGVKIMLSNSYTPFIHELYNSEHYTCRIVQARRNINSVASGRGKVDEVLILNYEA